jgi:hypothetical protein
MSGFPAVVRRELQEKWFVLVGALVIGVLPFFAPLLLSAMPPAEIRNVTGETLAALFAVFVAGFAATTAFSTELGQRRMSFYLSTPLSPGVLAAGKLLAAAALTVAAYIVAAAPTGLFAFVSGAPDEIRPFGAAVGLASVMMVPALAYAAVAMRARTWWLVVDIVGAAGSIWLLAWLIRQPDTFNPYAAYHKPWLLAIPGAALIIAPVAAIYAGVARGRTDLRRWHRAAALTFWVSVAAAAVLTGASLAWIRSATIEDLRFARIEGPAARGIWATISGPPRWRGGVQRHFLFEPAGGTSRPVGARSAAVSADGTRFAWMELRGSEPAVVRIETRDGRAATRANVQARGVWHAVELSPAGSRIAVATARLIEVFECDSGRHSPRLRSTEPVVPGSIFTTRRRCGSTCPGRGRSRFWNWTSSAASSVPSAGLPRGRAPASCSTPTAST